MTKNVSASIRAAQLAKAEPNKCWKNAASLMFEAGFESARYVEGIVLAPTAPLPLEHGWVVLEGDIIDPTLPETDVRYFPALEWSKAEFLLLYFADTDMPFFRRISFSKDGVHAEMDDTRRMAHAYALNRRKEP